MISSKIQWYVNGKPFGSPKPLPSTLDTTELKDGDRVTYKITATNQKTGRKLVLKRPKK